MKRWFVRIVGGIVALVVIAAATIFALSQWKLGRSPALPALATATEVASPDSSRLARGRHLATAIGKCVECHGEDLGGKMFMDNGAMGTIIAPNLTSGSSVPRTAADYERAIRHGVGTSGKPLAFMPSEAYAHLSRADMAALIAYLQSVPAVTRADDARSLGPISRMLIATGQMHLAVDLIDHGATPPERIEEGATVAYGEYLANVGGCTGCHSANLSGGKITGPPGTPPASNLTPGGRDWTLPDFTRALREGIRPGGAKIDPFMPWNLTRLMTDQEIEAVWMYIRSVPAKSVGED